MNGDKFTMSAKKKKVMRPDHIRHAKSVKLVRIQRACHASHQEDQTPIRPVSAMERIVSMSAKLAARKPLRKTVDDRCSTDKQQTLAEEPSTQAIASDRFRLVER